jgi:HK97 family phage portal protein
MIQQEVRSNLRSPDAWLVDALGGTKSSSGEDVSATTALALSAYFCAIRAISTDIGKLSLSVFQREPNGDKRERRDLPLFKLLHDVPNSDMTAQTWKETSQAHALGFSGGFSLIGRDSAGRPTSIFPLDPNMVSPHRDKDTGVLSYAVRESEMATEARLFPQQDILHIHGLGLDGVTQLIVANMGKESLGAGLAAQKHRGSWFGNGANPSGILEVPGALDEQALKRLRDTFYEKYVGTGKGGKVIPLEEGTKFTTVTSDPEKSQLVNSLLFTVEDVARWFRIQPSKLMHLLKANFNTLEMQNLEYFQDTLQEWLVKWESEIKRKLLSDAGQENIFVEFDLRSLLRGDLAARNSSYTAGRQWGWLSANDVRRAENMNSIGGQGDIYMIPANMLDASAIGTEGDTSTAPQTSDDERALSSIMAHGWEGEARQIGDDNKDMLQQLVLSHSSMFTDTIGRLFRTVDDKAKRAKRRELDFVSWASGFLANHREHAREAITGCVDCVANTASIYRGAEYIDVAPHVAGYIEAFADRHCARAEARISTGSTAQSDIDAAVVSEMQLLGGVLADALRKDSD